ncbi:ABC transporter ATP-binding protein [Candidatus Nomurabacteria bacterium]|nr:ABC transporter ATP-binding protein [Candidatus Nomurabacteria bacterium]
MVFGSAIIGSILDVWFPIFFKDFFDVVVREGSLSEKKDELYAILWMIFVVAALSRAVWTVSDYVGTKYHSSVLRSLAQYCFEYVHRHSVGFFNNNFVGSLVRKHGRFVWAFDSLSASLVWDLLPLIVSFIGISVVLAMQSVFLTALLAIWSFILILSTLIFSRAKLPIDVEVTSADSAISGQLADTFTNQVNVKYFNARPYEAQRFDDLEKSWQKIYVKSLHTEAHFRVFQGVMMIALQVGILWLAIMLWEQGRFTVGDFALIQAYVFTLSHKMWNLKHIIRNYYKSMADAQEMTEILETPIEITDKRNAKPLELSDGEIVFDKTTFSYHQTRTILKKLDLTIESKQKVALVGHSGAGKSTIVKLLMRQHDVTAGKILIDGQKISDVTQESLWEHLSFVPQEPILFHRSLMENIRYGKPDATDKEVVNAAKLAHADEFISNFPEGYETYVGERGVKLSGGERQRVAIARAILRNAPILILDEATSSLDSESEALIQQALDYLTKDKTVIVIAHRLSTIQKMDRIIVMEEGTIIEDGNHAQLLKKKKGMYAKLWKLQAGGFIE